MEVLPAILWTIGITVVLAILGSVINIWEKFKETFIYPILGILMVIIIFLLFWKGSTIF